MSGFVRVPYDDLAAIQAIASRKNNVVAVLVEPVQGEGGVYIPADMSGYFKGLRKLCDDNGWLFMVTNLLGPVLHQDPGNLYFLDQLHPLWIHWIHYALCSEFVRH